MHSRPSSGRFNPDSDPAEMAPITRSVVLTVADLAKSGIDGEHAQEAGHTDWFGFVDKSMSLWDNARTDLVQSS